MSRFGQWWAYFLYDLLGLIFLFCSFPWILFRILRDPGLPRHLWLRLSEFKDCFEPKELRILLHGVSVGEVKALVPLWKKIQEDLPNASVLVSSSTPSGLQVAKNLFGNSRVVVFPLDFFWSCRRFFQSLRPTHVILAELEIWPNFLKEASARKIPVGVVNGRITTRSLRGYKKIQHFLPRFNQIDFFAVQNEIYASRFKELGVNADRLWVTGNLKFDVDHSSRSSITAKFSLPGKLPIVVLASTHEPEEEHLVSSILELGALNEALWVCFPRHPARSRSLLSRLGRLVGEHRCFIFSEWIDGGCPEEVRLLLVDEFGMLEAGYRDAVAAFVGGSLIGHGGQNVLEAAAFSRPMVVGPYTQNFSEEVAIMADVGALRCEETAKGVVEYLLSWLSNPGEAAASGLRGRQALLRHQGATQKTLNALYEANFFTKSFHG